jgi:hypothetical protein
MTGRDYLGELGIGGRIILKKIGCEDVNWIHLLGSG